MITRGSENIIDIRKGDSNVSKVMRGNVQVWPSGLEHIKSIGNSAELKPTFFISNFGNWQLRASKSYFLTKKITNYNIENWSGSYQSDLNLNLDDLIGAYFSYSGTYMYVAFSGSPYYIRCYQMTNEAFRPDLGYSFVGQSSYVCKGLSLNSTTTSAMMYDQGRNLRVMNITGFYSFTTSQSTSISGNWDVYANYATHHYFAKIDNGEIVISQKKTNNSYDLTGGVTDVAETTISSHFPNASGYVDVYNIDVSSTGEYIYILGRVLEFNDISTYIYAQYRMPSPYNIT